VTWRDTIADAINGIAPGVVVTPAPPDVPTAGAGWPSWVSAEADTYCGLLNTWHVIILLPNPNTQTVIDAGDPLVGLVFAALTDIGEVSIVEPIQVQTSDPTQGNAQPALRFTMTTTGAAP